MGEIPDTVRTALEPVDVAGKLCLEAGAGVGNMTRALRAAGAASVVAVSNDRSHVRNLGGRDGFDDVHGVYADLMRGPFDADRFEVVTVHALCNVLTPAALHEVLDELGRVTASSGKCVVVDYEPLPSGLVSELFALENAVATLESGSPMYSFYPSDLLEDLFCARGWSVTTRQQLLDPVPWSASLLDEHASIADAGAESFDDGLEQALQTRVAALRDRIPGDGVEAGQYYALVFERE